MREAPKTKKLRLAATADMHWPKYQSLFISALGQFPAYIDIVLLAGDLVQSGDKSQIHPLLSKLKERKLECPIYACFGNDDYEDIEEDLREAARGLINFLDDELEVVTIRGVRVAIVGSRGVLDQPTFWQSRNIPDIRTRYTERVGKLDRLLAEARSKAEHVILLSHYAPTFTTLRGEPVRAHPQMGSQRVERLLHKHGPTLVIHGHAHRGSRRAWVGTVPVYNVALPLCQEFVVVEFPQPRGLERFMAARAPSG